MAHQYMPKMLHDPHKNSSTLPPTYLMYSPQRKLYTINAEKFTTRSKNQCNI